MTLLLDNGANIDKLGSLINETSECSALHYAIMQRNKDMMQNNKNMMEFLIKRGADINCANYDEYTPMHMACKTGQYEIVKMLLEKGAHITRENLKGEAPLPLDLALNMRERYIHRKTLNEEIPPNDYTIQTDNRFQIVNELLKHHRPKEEQHVTSETSLFEALDNGLHDIVELLLLKCPDININTRRNKEKLEVINRIMSRYNISALETALSSGMDDTALLLLRKGAEWNINKVFFCYKNGREITEFPNIAFSAAAGNCPKALFYFLNENIDLNKYITKFAKQYVKFAKSYKADKTVKVLRRQQSIASRERIKSALLVFQRISKKKKALNKDVIRKILSYLMDDVLAGAVYTKELVPTNEYLKETMRLRFTIRYSRNLRTPYANKETLLKFLDLTDGANE